MKLSIVISICALLYFSGHTLATSRRRIRVDCHQFKSYGSHCPEEYKPLCGSDGVTYANDCKYCAACREKGSRILVRHRGECKEKKQQPLETEPLSVDCQQFKSYGSYCTLEYNPLCGSNGVTYSNDCNFCAAKREKGSRILVRHRGECKEKKQQPLETEPLSVDCQQFKSYG
ncbi:double-headed protease inhibitor, submandibular gland-like, partial [Clupea harengus]|uniref:Double-headed protease inhibitor, submandibular gland-like n=1 Tax=Clupea harengus TaxID=7950 RepID=A0A6P8EEN8_CLUHA